MDLETGIRLRIPGEGVQGQGRVKGGCREDLMSGFRAQRLGLRI